MNKLAVVSLLGAVISASAIAAPQIPQQCPNVNLIKSSAYMLTFEGSSQGKNYYIAQQPEQKYGTSEIWSFNVSGIEASSIQEAQDKMKTVLATLTLKNGPNDYGSAWQCAYANVNNEDARALTGRILR